MEMKIVRRIACVVVCFLLIGAFVLLGQKKDIGSCIEYKCDVKNLQLSTTIEIDKEGEKFQHQRINFFRNENN